MEVFRIEKKKDQQTLPPQEENPSAPGDVQAVGERTMAAPAAVDTPPAESVPDNTPENKPVEKTKKILTVTGPIGELMTKALNEVLSLESYMFNMTSVDEAPEFVPEEEDVDDPNNPDDGIIEIMAFDGTSLNLEDVQKVSDQVRRHQNRGYVIVIENIYNQPKRPPNMNIVSFMDELEIYGNIKVVYTLESALQIIRGELKDFHG